MLGGKILRINNDVVVRCEECDSENIIFGTDIEFEVTSVEERGMGEEIGYDAHEERCCQNCGNEITVRITVYEYPLGVLNYDDHSASGGTFSITPDINYSLLPIDVYDFEQDEGNYNELLTSITKEIRSRRKELKDLSADEFEDLVKEFFERKGFTVEKTQKTRDGGKDLIAKIDHQGIPFIVFIECKHHRKKIGIEFVRQLYGVQNIERVNKAILVTSSSFTKDAIKFSNETKYMIDLIDGQTILNDIMQDY
jgi:Holliday junction resolvase-like predicted endonuclease